MMKNVTPRRIPMRRKSHVDVRAEKYFIRYEV